MSKKHPPLVIGNWKMNPIASSMAKKIFLEIGTAAKQQKATVTVAIAPPFPYLPLLLPIASKKKILLGAQDFYHVDSGACTGEVSLPMLKDVGVSLVIVGHSERRELGDSSERITSNVAAGLKHGMKVVLCVGERKRSKEGDHFTFVETQLTEALRGIPKAKLRQLVVAYEPVWAIGTGKHATGEDIEEMRLFIQKILSDMYDRKTAAQVPILYGGSVDRKNAADILTSCAIDGFLVGGASLRSSEFADIIKHTKAHFHASTT